MENSSSVRIEVVNSLSSKDGVVMWVWVCLIGARLVQVPGRGMETGTVIGTG